MCAIPQLVSAPLNPIPIVEHFRRSHPQCEHSKGPCKRSQHCWPTRRNIVGSNMLRAFAHHVVAVATCWKLLDEV